ncbi:hypothetical protein Q5424_00660 [Conexibacter sp. JD483]|uniref:hypothetical protein n=1 Tax=unclassified Conexibacter TaxID=2627773 RepID=UPI00271D5A76|nr:MULTISPECIES: hypothetical protein [unclassified Conexibacter]MDO8184125.1 hypothetical protein [Conexibacter sp. CPCC 205706]MDO8197117.1 hypothetical protein [Conexibacter sp. CPCC 205762]MDR9367568.1 hypothetical protein [Conexibacter sp. JD483]
MSDAEPPYLYSSGRLPRGTSHLIKRSDLDAQLAGVDPCPFASVSRYGTWYASHFPDVGLVLCRASWRMHETPVLATPGVDVSFHPVPSERRAELRALAVERVIPAAIAWARDVVDGPETRRDLRPQVSWLLVDGELVRRDER